MFRLRLVLDKEMGDPSLPLLQLYCVPDHRHSGRLHGVQLDQNQRNRKSGVPLSHPPHRYSLHVLCERPGGYSCFSYNQFVCVHVLYREKYEHRAALGRQDPDEAGDMRLLRCNVFGYNFSLVLSVQFLFRFYRFRKQCPGILSVLRSEHLL